MSAPQPQMIFVNLPVQDLNASKTFSQRWATASTRPSPMTMPPAW